MFAKKLKAFYTRKVIEDFVCMQEASKEANSLGNLAYPVCN